MEINPNDKHLIVIGGPTASGKTDLSIAIAQKYQAEIFSADARQFYKEMKIGTAKPSSEELAAVPHHFINSHSIADKFTVADYEKAALRKLQNYFTKKDIAVIVGGSGLFLKAVCDGLDPIPKIKTEIREKVLRLLETEGLEKLKALVKTHDPEFYAKADVQNPRRLQRALEIYWSSGKKISSLQKGKPKARPFKIHRMLLLPEREKLYERINFRCAEMLEAGLLAEAKNLYSYRHLPPLQTVGYREFFDHFDQKYTYEEAVEKFKQHTRNYAKRQMTWFKKDERYAAFPPEDRHGIFAHLDQILDG